MGFQKKQKKLLNQVFKSFIVGLLISFAFIIAELFINSFSFKEYIIESYQSISFYIILLFPFIISFAVLYLSRESYSENRELESALRFETKKKNEILSFIEGIKSGKSDVDLVFDDTDKLSVSLLELKETIFSNRKREVERQKESEQRTWINEGIAKFTEILRGHTTDVNLIAKNLISEIVNYMGANQGGFFVKKEINNEVIYDLSSAYAYERFKYVEKQVKLGEGFVGTAALEKQPIYMKDVPPTYMNITSGLGKATPRIVLIVPMKFNEKVEGVLELASFHDFEDYQIDFIERVGENIASTLSNISINRKTERLLEDSRKQADALAQNEEQMRQNMEELQAAQEEIARQSEKFVSFTNTVNHTLIRAEYSTDGTLLYANTNFLYSLGYSKNSEVEGKKNSMFLRGKDREWFDRIWNNLSKGGKHFEGNMKHVTKQGKDLWTMATYTCMKLPDGKIEKILFLALDITEQMEKSLDNEGQINALNKSSVKAEFSIEGEFIDCNDKFTGELNYEQISDIEDKKIFDFIEKVDLKEFKSIWNKVIKGDFWSGDLRILKKDGDSLWFDSTLTAVLNMYGEVEKIILISKNITKEKAMEFEMQKQNQQLKEQEELLKSKESGLQDKLSKAKEEIIAKYRETEKSIKIYKEVLQEMDFPLILFNKRGRVHFINKYALEVWQIEEKEARKGGSYKLFEDKSLLENKNLSKIIVDREEADENFTGKINIINTKGQKIGIEYSIYKINIDDELFYLMNIRTK